MGGASEVAELIARVAKLEAEIKDMAARLDRLEAASANRAHKDRREGDAVSDRGVDRIVARLVAARRPCSSETSAPS